MRSKMSVMNEFRIAMDFLETPISAGARGGWGWGWGWLRGQHLTGLAPQRLHGQQGRAARRAVVARSAVAGEVFARVVSAATAPGTHRWRRPWRPWRSSPSSPSWRVSWPYWMVEWVKECKRILVNCVSWGAWHVRPRTKT